MYAEIKDSERILINRLADSERILLKQIADNSKTADITFSELNGETGDFDGVMVNVKPVGPKKIEVKEPILTEITVLVGEAKEYVLPVEEGVTILTSYNNENLKVTASDNELLFFTNGVFEDTVKYEITKEGYESLPGEINVISKERDEVTLVINTDPADPDAILVFDEHDTKLIPVNPDVINTYSLPVGTYRIMVSKINYKQVEDLVTITSEDLANKTKTITINLITNENDIIHLVDETDGEEGA